MALAIGMYDQRRLNIGRDIVRSRTDNHRGKQRKFIMNTITFRKKRKFFRVGNRYFLFDFQALATREKTKHIQCNQQKFFSHTFSNINQKT
jgi:hypothetical protein